MKTPVLFLIFLGLAFARGESANKNNQLENKNAHQTSEANGLETASTRNAHMQYQGNRMENVHNQDQKFSQHQQMQNSQSLIQHQNAQFHAQNQGAQIHNQEVAQQFHSQNQAQQFHNQGQGQVQQFRSQGHLATGAPSVHSEQEIANLLQSQQRMTPTAISVIQAQTKEQHRDFSAQQVYSGGVHPEQELYQERRSMMDVQDKLGERRFSDSTTEQTQVHRGVQSTEVRASGFPSVYLQRSVFDNREQPLVLPGVSQTHASSVVVSGLKNLPTLPGLVYSAGPVPSGHAVAYSSRPWYQGGAYVKQHWQTPYARYVYSHIL